MSNSWPTWIGRPAAQAYGVPYDTPRPPANPVVRGLALHYGAQIISSSSLIQNYLWANAGFDRLRNRPELKDIDPRYDPTVIKLAGGPFASGRGSLDSLLGEDWHRPSPGAYASILDYHEAYKSGKLTPTAVAEGLLPLVRRDVKNATKHAIAFLGSKVELILKAAHESTERYGNGTYLSPLDGVPVAVKDEEDVTGYKKCLGSKLDYTRKDDATSHCVQLWQVAGAVLIGKTTMHELGLDTTNNNPNYGTPLNPHNERYYCGGSSGGSGYAVSAGLVPVAIGNDGGGSIRIPSAYCGLYGLKPSHSRVSIRPSSNLAKSTGVAGPMAANMADLEIGYRVMAQPDALDPASKLFLAPSGQASVRANRKKVLGIYKQWFDRADAPVREACEQTLDYLTSKLDYEIVEITIPMIHEAQLAHAMTIMNEIASGVSSVKDLTPANKVLISTGSKTPAPDFLQAQKLRNLLMQHLAHLYEQHPGMVIVTPTTPNAGWPYHPADLRYGCSDGNTQIRNMEYVYLANFVGNPAITAPISYLGPAVGSGKIPIGIMGMGEWCTEDELIAFGYDCETYLNDVYEGGRVKPGNFVDVMGLVKTIGGE
ncbi:hypothetical protein LTR85_005575 [Meristemomyces frigidus]|nr:hypothetical protein LTR85_005575 [Meristemomyces frigidus]